MKNSVKITALVLLASTGIFASASAKPTDVPATRPAVTIAAMPSHKGISVTMDKNAAGRSIVLFYDQDKNVIRKDVLANTGTAAKAYVLSGLENGDYTMEVISDSKTVTRNIHIYNEDKTKTFIVQD